LKRKVLDSWGKKRLASLPEEKPLLKKPAVRLFHDSPWKASACSEKERSRFKVKNLIFQIGSKSTNVYFFQKSKKSIEDNKRLLYVSAFKMNKPLYDGNVEISFIFKGGNFSEKGMEIIFRFNGSDTVNWYVSSM
jgi:hypothetical protein